MQICHCDYYSSLLILSFPFISLHILLFCVCICLFGVFFFFFFFFVGLFMGGGGGGGSASHIWPEYIKDTYMGFITIFSLLKLSINNYGGREVG